MARSRIIKIGFFENEDLAQLPDKARLLYAGLWLLADRSGRLEDRPLRLRGQLFPYEPVDVDTHLEELARAGFVVRYEVAGARYIAIPKFLAHQNPHMREAPSKLPPIPESLGSARAEHRLSTDLARAEHQPSPAVSVLDLVSVPTSVSVSKTVPVSESVSEKSVPVSDGKSDTPNRPANNPRQTAERAERGKRLEQFAKTAIELNPIADEQLLVDTVIYVARSKGLTVRATEATAALQTVRAAS